MISEKDKEQRRRAIEDANCSFVVEASAGSGKTSALLNRILHLVLQKGPDGKPVRLSQICAITFTEKAAGEMKVRLRKHFEQLAVGKDARPSDVARAREALHDIESASISTFHSFAVSLLKERPIDAGLDPHFTALDEIRSELFFREVWDAWMSKALSERRPILEKALRNGIALRNLMDIAGTIRRNSNASRELACDAPDEAELQSLIKSLLEEGEKHFGKNLNPDDRLVDYLRNAMNWMRNPEADCPAPGKPGNAGAAANWSGGKPTVLIVKEFIKEAAECYAAFQKLPAQKLLNEIIRWIVDDFMNEWESRKRAAGLLDFDDQLRLARDLLLANQSVRREFQSRYATLLVDEFQDTDSIQWDIVRLLSSDNPDETDLKELRPEPGKLFIVGDPKQSIYRFRNADIETYLEIVEPDRLKSLGMELLQLTTNFRSVPSLLRFVDEAFQDNMKAPSDGFYQPDYLPFGGQGGREVELSSPSVHLLGDRKPPNVEPDDEVDFLEVEAARIARLIGEMRGSESWKIQEHGGGRWRAPEYGDIAILLPALSRADIMEDALRELEIPYVLDGGKFYYARSEVSSAITALRAIANPNDSVALYGALRSIFFGFSDEDLLRARIEDQKLDYRACVPDNSPFFHPFEILRDLHNKRHERNASETFELLLHRTGARETLAPRGFQSLANLNKLTRTLRSLQQGRTFSQMIDLLSSMDEEGLAESESRLMEEQSEAVRVMSIHKSKGLDFPIVFVAGLGQQRKPRNGNFIADFHHRKIFGISVYAADGAIQTPKWKELKEEEKKREDAELMRLLYVALTRARDHMVVGVHVKNWRPAQEDCCALPETGRTRLEPLSGFLENCISKDPDFIRWVDVQSLERFKKPKQPRLLCITEGVGAALEQQYKELRELVQNTPCSRKLQAAGESAHSEDRSSEERALAPAASRAARLGTAFHEAMERADLLRPEAFSETVKELAAQHNLDQEGAQALEEMARTSLSSELLERARSAIRSNGRVLRELPFTRPVDGAIEEGKIDLLFEEKDGWVLVDYKTDKVAGDKEKAEKHFREKYSGQVREYIEAMKQLSITVSAAYLLLARNGRDIKML